MTESRDLVPPLETKSLQIIPVGASHRGMAEALVRGQREGEEYSGFWILPSSCLLVTCQCLLLAKRSQHPNVLGAWKYGQQESALQHQGKNGAEQTGSARHCLWHE